MSTDAIHILYILRSFPTVTEMSTLNEITGMIRKGMEVSIVSLKKPAGSFEPHEDVEKYGLIRKTHYLNVESGIRKWQNILLRTLNGWYRLLFQAQIPLKKKFALLQFSLKKSSRRISLIHYVDLVNHISGKNPTVIYFHFASHAGELIFLRKIFPIPYVVFFHGFDFSKQLDYPALNYPEMFRRGDCFLTNSRFAGQKILSLGCPEDKLSVVGLPVDDFQYPYKIRNRGESIRILTVARLVEKKGLEYSIEAMAKVIEWNKGSDIQYRIIGDGPLEKSLLEMIHRMGMADHVFLMGSKKKSEVIDFMLNSDIFLLSSITAQDGETEGLPMVSLESQLTGMPIIATLHSGFTDAIIDGVSGFLVPERDVEALANRLNWLISHPDSWEKMGQAGRNHVMAHFSENVYLHKVIGHIQAARIRITES